MGETEEIYIISDSGGTMTDTFVLRKDGNFVVGKVSTTIRDESIGYWESLKDAFGHWGIDLDQEARDILPNTRVAVYSGTTMLNTLLTRTGPKIGLIITKGHEHSLLHERGAQVHAGYSYADKSHVVTHIHNEPFVPSKAVSELLDRDVKGIAILFLCSFDNPDHEKRAAEIAREVMQETGR